MHRFVAGLGVVAISVRGFTILYNLDGFLCGAFLFKAALLVGPPLVLLQELRLPAEEVGGSGGGTIPFGGSFGGLDEWELEEIFCSRWLLLLMGEEEMGMGSDPTPPAAWFVSLCGGRGKVGEVVPVKKKSKQTVDDKCSTDKKCWLWTFTFINQQFIQKFETALLKQLLNELLYLFTTCKQREICQK